MGCWSRFPPRKGPLTSRSSLPPGRCGAARHLLLPAACSGPSLLTCCGSPGSRTPGRFRGVEGRKVLGSHPPPGAGTPGAPLGAPSRSCRADGPGQGERGSCASAHAALRLRLTSPKRHGLPQNTWLVATARYFRKPQRRRACPHTGNRLGIASPNFLLSPLPWIRYHTTAVIITIINGFNSPCGEGARPSFGTDLHNLQEREIPDYC